MGITQVHNKVLALLSGTVADALDLKRLGKAVCNALNHVVDKSSCQTVERLVQLILGRTVNNDLCALLLDDDIGVERICESTLGSLYRNG